MLAAAVCCLTTSATGPNEAHVMKLANIDNRRINFSFHLGVIPCLQIGATDCVDVSTTLAFVSLPTSYHATRLGKTLKLLVRASVCAACATESPLLIWLPKWRCGPKSETRRESPVPSLETLCITCSARRVRSVKKPRN